MNASVCICSAVDLTVCICVCVHSQVISSAYWNHMIISSSSKLIPELQRQQNKLKDSICFCWQSACFSKYVTSGGHTYCTFNDLSSKTTTLKSPCLFNLVSNLPFKRGILVVEKFRAVWVQQESAESPGEKKLFNFTIISIIRNVPT